MFAHVDNALCVTRVVGRAGLKAQISIQAICAIHCAGDSIEK